MFHDDREVGIGEHFEISIRFRQMMEERICRLESDALKDELATSRLENSDHIQRQTRLVNAQRKEALRMRRFLEQSSTRMPSRPLPI